MLCGFMAMLKKEHNYNVLYVFLGSVFAYKKYDKIKHLIFITSKPTKYI